MNLTLKSSAVADLEVWKPRDAPGVVQNLGGIAAVSSPLTSALRACSALNCH